MLEEEAKKGSINPKCKQSLQPKLFEFDHQFNYKKGTNDNLLFFSFEKI